MWFSPFASAYARSGTYAITSHNTGFPMSSSTHSTGSCCHSSTISHFKAPSSPSTSPSTSIISHVQPSPAYKESTHLRNERAFLNEAPLFRTLKLWTRSVLNRQVYFYALMEESFRYSSIFVWPRFFINNCDSSHSSSSQKGAHSLSPLSSSAASRDSNTVFFLPRIVAVTPGYHSVKCPDSNQQGKFLLSPSARVRSDGGSQRSGGPGSTSAQDG